MSGTTDRPGGTGEQPHIWLRYATQFSSGGRAYTIEMGIPVPLGASAETREQLIREAEAGMEQLSRHVEGRITHMHQRNQPAPGTGQRDQELSQGSNPSTQTQQSKNTVSTPPTPTSKIPQTLAPTASNIPAQIVTRDEQIGVPPVTHNKEAAVSVPPTRPSIGASMPMAPGRSGEANANLLLPNFLQTIKETWGLTPKQAMEMLKVKSLNGLNLRDALGQLQVLMDQGSGGGTAQGQRTTEGNLSRQQSQTSPLPSSPSTPSTSPIGARPGSPSRSLSPTVPDLMDDVRSQANGNERNTIHESRTALTFDEEEEMDLEEEESEDESMSLEDEDTAPMLTLSAADLARAKSVLSRLREARGSNLASPARLTVLHNVIGGQISEDFQNQLIEGVWGVNNQKKLKTDQLEALISWAKEDDFIYEAEAVLKLLEEE